jgi:FkbM family methyltransferase
LYEDIRTEGGARRLLDFPAMPYSFAWVTRRACSPLSDEFTLALRLGNKCIVTQISMDDHWRLAWGIARSLWIYYRSPGRRRRMDRLYARFVRPGDLVFDIGAHVGDRTAAFCRLGCRVIAVEPQPPLVGLLHKFYGHTATVMIAPVAVAASPGNIELMINSTNPTLTTASPLFVASAAHARGWRREHWGRRLRVPAVTLDQLIERHGEPSFLKLDVEGFEDKALAGLSRPIRALSFEFTTIARGVAARCLARCQELGPYVFNAAYGETQRLVFADWVDGETMARWLEALPDRINSGDIYAQL